MYTASWKPAVRTNQNTTADRSILLDDKALVAQCEVDRYRSGGPGGQKRNKTSSAIRLRHRSTGLAVVATEDRSQHVNMTRAIRRMREAIALDVRSRIDLDSYARSELLSSCISQDGRLCVGRRDQRYYPAVSEMLDLIAAYDGRVSEAAQRIGVSTANLVKLFQNDLKLLKCVNQMRSDAGVKPLR
jgi:hypothetical protein